MRRKQARSGRQLALKLDDRRKTMASGTVVNLLTARRFGNEAGEQEPYEYSDVTNADQVVVTIRVLFASVSTGCSVVIKIGNYRRADCMRQFVSQTITTVDATTVYQIALGRSTEYPLGAWLAIGWEAASGDLMVVEVKGIAR